MEILSEGKLPEDRLYEATCRNCQTKIRFAEKEGNVRYDQRDGNYVTVACPLCSRDINVSIPNYGS